MTTAFRSRKKSSSKKTVRWMFRLRTLGLAPGWESEDRAERHTCSKEALIIWNGVCSEKGLHLWEFWSRWRQFLLRKHICLFPFSQRLWRMKLKLFLHYQIVPGKLSVCMKYQSMQIVTSSNPWHERATYQPSEQITVYFFLQFFVWYKRIAITFWGLCLHQCICAALNLSQKGSIFKIKM